MAAVQYRDHARIQRKGHGSAPSPLPLENHKAIDFPSNTGPDPIFPIQIK